MSEAPLYERDPEAWTEHLAAGNRTQPRKRVSADVVLRDPDGRVLIVEPTYKPGWDTPGGMSEANEPPHETVRRELREELNLDVRPVRLLVVDWVPPHGPWDDLLAFVYDGGVLPVGVAPRPSDGELRRAEFCPVSQLDERLPARLNRRIAQALTSLADGRVRYLVDGEEAS